MTVALADVAETRPAHDRHSRRSAEAASAPVGPASLPDGLPTLSRTLAQAGRLALIAAAALMLVVSDRVGGLIALTMSLAALAHALAAASGGGLSALVALAPGVSVLASLPVVLWLRGAGVEELALLTAAGACALWAILGLRRQVLAARAQTRAVRDEAAHAQDTLLNLVSHEIRTPLNGMLGMAQVIAGESMSADQGERLEILIASGQSLHARVSELLDLSVIRAGPHTSVIAPFDLAMMVQEAMIPFAAGLAAAGSACRLTVSPRSPSAYKGDLVRVRQIVHALLAASVAEGEGDLDIEVDGHAEGFSISASRRRPHEDRAEEAGGIGDVRRQTVAPPAALHNVDSWWAERLAQRFGGNLSSTSSRDQRRLALHLPMPMTNDLASPPTPRRAAPALPRGLRVLVAEDHPVNRKVLSLILAGFEAVTTVVEDGAQAVEACIGERWDLVLMDIQMPVLDGVSAARRIKEDAEAAGRVPPPIIAVTADVMAHQVSRYREAGMSSWVAKPIQTGGLVEAIQAAIQGPDRLSHHARRG